MTALVDAMIGEDDDESIFGALPQLGALNPFEALVAQQEHAVKLFQKSEEKERAAILLAKAPASLSESQEEEDEQMEMDTAPEVLVEALEDDEDEPCCFESDVIFPVESGVDSPPPSQIHELCRMASEEASCTAWHMMLQQGTVFDCLGAGKNVAQALFTAVCSPGTAPEEVQTAFEELTKCLKLQKDWLPTLMEFYCAFEALGYRSSPTGSSSDLAANQQQQGSNNAMLRYRPIQILLQTLCFVCELVIASPSLNLSFASDKESGSRLIIALHRMRLDPAVMSAMQPELSRAREALAEAWAASDERGWLATRGSVAERVVGALGPTHRAVLRAIACPPGKAHHAAIGLSQAVAIDFLRSLLRGVTSADEIKSGSVGSRASGDFIKQLRDLLGGAQEARAIVVALKPDFWKIKTIVQAADMVMWPLQLTGDVPSDAWRWWSEELKALDDCLGKAPKAADARRTLSLIKNNHDFSRN